MEDPALADMSPVLLYGDMQQRIRQQTGFACRSPVSRCPVQRRLLLEPLTRMRHTDYSNGSKSICFWISALVSSMISRIVFAITAGSVFLGRGHLHDRSPASQDPKQFPAQYFFVQSSLNDSKSSCRGGFTGSSSRWISTPIVFPPSRRLIVNPQFLPCRGGRPVSSRVRRPPRWGSPRAQYPGMRGSPA